jgi:hypothetical protein
LRGRALIELLAQILVQEIAAHWRCVIISVDRLQYENPEQQLSSRRIPSQESSNSGRRFAFPPGFSVTLITNPWGHFKANQRVVN